MRFAVIVGYTNKANIVFCSACWREKAPGDRRPNTVLVTENLDGPDDNFWIVDICEGCGREVKYKDSQLLG